MTDRLVSVFTRSLSLGFGAAGVVSLAIDRFLFRVEEPHTFYLLVSIAMGVLALAYKPRYDGY